VQDSDGYVAKLQNIPLVDTTEGKGHDSLGKKDIFGTGGLGEDAACGDVVGVEMGINYIADIHAQLLSSGEIGWDIAKWIDYGRNSLASASEEIRSRNGIGVQVLTQDHWVPPWIATDVPV
jgi:hypothetical protein